MSQFRQIPEDVLETEILPRLPDEDAMALIDEICPACFYKLKNNYLMSEWLKMPENFIPTRIDYDLETVEELQLLPNRMKELNIAFLILNDVEKIHLPKYVEDLGIGTAIIEKLMEWPNGLKTLRIINLGSNYEMITPVPDGVVELYLLGVRPLHNYPDSLRTLYIRETRAAIPPLPEKLEKFELFNVNGRNQLLQLNDNLKHLILRETVDVLVPPVLPSRLETFIFTPDNNHNWVPNIPIFPETLKVLGLRTHFYPELTVYPPNLKEIYLDPQFREFTKLRYLPKTIEKIQIGNRHYDLGDEEINLREEFPNLKKFVYDKYFIDM